MYERNQAPPVGEPLEDRLAPVTLRSEKLFMPPPEVDCSVISGESADPATVVVNKAEVMSVSSMEGLPDPRLEAAIVAGVLMGLFVLDDKGRLLYFNRFAERFFEQVCGRSREELLGKSFWQKCPEVADSVFVKEYRQALAGQRNLELVVCYPALGRWFLFHAPPAEDVHCIFFHDVTERVRLERELRLLREQLAASER
jgi:PAS domain S-box-containing protein